MRRKTSKPIKKIEEKRDEKLNNLLDERIEHKKAWLCNVFCF